jgi:hypothetical protein
MEVSAFEEEVRDSQGSPIRDGRVFLFLFRANSVISLMDDRQNE